MISLYLSSSKRVLNRTLCLLNVFGTVKCFDVYCVCLLIERNVCAFDHLYSELDDGKVEWL